MVSIELVYDAGCPTVEEARRNLKLALDNLALPATWAEWERSSPFASWARQFDSPTILVNRNPVKGTGFIHDASCSSIVHQEQTAVPSVTTIEGALAQAVAREHAGGYAQRAAQERLTHPVALILLPLSCCLPLVLGALSSVGVGGMLSQDLPLTLAASVLAVALTSLSLLARRTRVYGPLVVGVVATAAIMVDKFALFYTPVTYGGITVLTGALVWGLAASWYKTSA